MTWAFAIDPLFIAILAAVVVLFAAREPRGATPAAGVVRLGLRLSVVAATGMILANPGSWRAATVPQPPRVALLVDHSRSMGVRVSDGCTRLAAFQRSWLSPEGIARLQAVSSLSVVAAAERALVIPAADAAALEPTGSLSRLAVAVSAALQGASARPADDATAEHIVLFTDGADTDGRSLAALAPRSSRARVHAVIPEDGDVPTDVRVEASFDRAWTPSADPAVLRVDIHQTGLAGRTVALVVREGGADGPIAFEREVVLSRRQRIEFEVHPAADAPPGSVAVARYTASIEPLADEVNRGNNRSTAHVQVVPRRVKVALFEAEPSWDTRFFIAAIESDPDIDLTTMMRVAASADRHQDQATPLHIVRSASSGDHIVRREEHGGPRTQADLDDFDVIVLGRDATALLGPGGGDRLRRFVEDRGGALVFLRGLTAQDAEDEALQSLAPARPHGGAERIEHPTLHDATPGERFFGGEASVREVLYRSGRLAPASVVLVYLTTPHKSTPLPLIADMPMGRGRTAAVLAEGLWRLSFTEPDGQATARRLWRGLVRRLAWGGQVPPGAPASILLDRTMVPPGESVNVIVRAHEGSLEEAELMLAGPDGGVEMLPLLADAGVGRDARGAVVRPRAEGEYVVRLVLPAADGGTTTVVENVVQARALDVEAGDMTVRRDDLNALADATGGEVYDAEGLDSFIERLAGETTSRTTPPRFESGWDRPWFFAVIVLAMSLEWWLRRRGGLI